MSTGIEKFLKIKKKTIYHFWKKKSISAVAVQYYEVSHPYVLDQALGITNFSMQKKIQKSQKKHQRTLSKWEVTSV